MFARRFRKHDDIEAPAAAAADPILAFAEWAMQRAEGVCWVRRDGDLQHLFDALAADLPELARSTVRWSGAGVLHDSGAEWFAFEGDGTALLVFAMGPAEQVAARQLGVLAALSAHAAYVIAGGAVARHLRSDLAGTVGVPAWALTEAARQTRKPAAA